MRIIEIPPQVDLLEDVERHAEGPLAIEIEFYRHPTTRNYFTWPYVRRDKGDCSSVKHFMVQGHFPDKISARAAAIDRGRKLIQTGFDPGTLD